MCAAWISLIIRRVILLSRDDIMVHRIPLSVLPVPDVTPALEQHICTSFHVDKFHMYASSRFIAIWLPSYLYIYRSTQARCLSSGVEVDQLSGSHEEVHYI